MQAFTPSCIPCVPLNEDRNVNVRNEAHLESMGIPGADVSTYFCRHYPKSASIIKNGNIAVTIEYPFIINAMVSVGENKTIEEIKDGNKTSMIYPFFYESEKNEKNLGILQINYEKVDKPEDNIELINKYLRDLVRDSSRASIGHISDLNLSISFGSKQKIRDFAKSRPKWTSKEVDRLYKLYLTSNKKNQKV
tara:strand:+ start:1194 stop:1772 length:579 start_codon:yes stop_codon:yes gene_type:complete